jgi:hypothetical protein
MAELTSLIVPCPPGTPHSVRAASAPPPSRGVYRGGRFRRPAWRRPARARRWRSLADVVEQFNMAIVRRLSFFTDAPLSLGRSAIAAFRLLGVARPGPDEHDAPSLVQPEPQSGAATDLVLTDPSMFTP